MTIREILGDKTKSCATVPRLDWLALLEKAATKATDPVHKQMIADLRFGSTQIIVDEVMCESAQIRIVCDLADPLPAPSEPTE